MENGITIQNILIEVCVDNLVSAMAAEVGGASRVELCGALSEGGITPSSGIILKARQLIAIDIFVMIRPRTGNFVYSENEFDSMLLDIASARELGANGIVSGMLNPDGSVDTGRTTHLVNASLPLPFTFHRAFDCTPDPFQALEDIIACGCTRILTSGQQHTAFEGRELIFKLIQQAGNRIAIMPGSGVNKSNVVSLISKTGAREVHLSGQKQLKNMHSNTNIKSVEASFGPFYETDPGIIQNVVRVVNSIIKDNF
jgi:copper homeostasis protein